MIHDGKGLLMSNEFTPPPLLVRNALNSEKVKWGKKGGKVIST